MTFPEHCIRRPVFTLVLTTLIVMTGLLYFMHLPLRHLPNIDSPAVTITTEFEGASPELVEKEITTPVENSLASVPGVDNIRSNSMLGKSRVTVDFQLGVDINDVVSDIRNKISALQAHLPTGSRAPIVNKNDADANPVLVIGFQAQGKEPLEITDYLNRYVKPALQEIQGVGEVVYHGGRDYAVKIALDPVKMASYQITVAEIKKALLQQNIDVPSGQIKSLNRYYTVVTQSRLENAHNFVDLVVAQHNHRLVRLNEIAHITVGSDNDDNLLRINGKPAVGLAILAQSNANPVDVAHNISQALKVLKEGWPQGFSADIIFDSTRFIKASIHEVYVTFLQASLFVGLVVLLFLGSFRAALIPIVTIPICLMGSFWPMYLLGFDLNSLTLLAMVLAIGLVVDDAIVVLENCHRHIQQGKNPIQAALQGSKEIVFAILAMTITLAAVYAPMGFVSGFTGKLFFQFGATLSVCVLLSGLVALSLSPMMCSRFLGKNEGAYSQWLDRLFDKMGDSYQKSLALVLNKPWYLFAVMVFTSIIGIACYFNLGAELAPVEDQSYVIGPVASPTNASISYTDYYTRQVEALYAAIPEKVNYFVSVRPASAFTVLKLRPWQERTRTQKEISEDLSEQMQQLTGINVYPVSPNPLGHRSGANSSQLSLALLGNTSYVRLNEISNEVVKSLHDFPELRHIKNNLALDSEQISIDINRQLAADLDVNLADIAELLSTMLGGSNPVNFNYDGQTYKVILQLKHSQRRDIAILNKLYVKSGRHIMVPLSSLIKVNHAIGPDSLPHLNRLRTANISAELAHDSHLSDILPKLQHLLQTKLPEDVQFRFTGAAKDYLESSGSSLFAMALAILFIYLVLAAQFESFRDPLIVMLSVPLCLAGALLALYLCQQTMSLYTNIGMITLIGLITKHGIMITEFANQKQRARQSKLQAVLESARIRLRPILMTTLAMLLGALPLAMASGAGAESRRQLGIVILGGMTLGTVFSLYIVPFAYLILAKNWGFHELTDKNRVLVSSNN